MRRPSLLWLVLAVVAAVMTAALVWAIGRDMTGSWGGRVMVLGGLVVVARWAEAARRRAWNETSPQDAVPPLGMVDMPGPRSRG